VEKKLKILGRLAAAASQLIRPQSHGKKRLAAAASRKVRRKHTKRQTKLNFQLHTYDLKVNVPALNMPP